MTARLHQPVADRASLLRSGMTPRGITAAVRSGQLVRVRRALYCLPGTDPIVQSALRAGGRLDCVTALAVLGVWVTNRHGPHVRAAPNAARLGTGAERVHWHPPTRAGGLVAVDPLDALVMAMRCQSEVDAIASVDSALHQRIVSLPDLRSECKDRRDRAILEEVDGRSESGLESILRVVLRRLGLAVQIQVRIPDVGRVDLLVEGVIVVETDGRAYHAGARRHVDHQRDAAAAANGLTPLRFDAHQVHDELVSVVMAILGAVRTHRGAHFSGQEARRVRIRIERMLAA